MNTMKRFVAICLCLCLLIPIAGCGGKKEGGDGAGGETAGDGFVYTAEFKGLAGNSLEKADVQGNRMYYADWDYDEESQTSTGSIKYLDLDTLANETFPFALAEGESVACLQALEDKSLLLLLAVWNENDMNQTYFLVKTDGSGTETMRLDATGFLTEGSAQDLNYGYPQAMQTDAEGNIYILVSGMEEKVVVLNAQGSLLFELANQNWSQGMCRSGDGRVFLLSYDSGSEDGSCMLQYIDPKAKGYGESFGGIPMGNGSVLCAASGEKEILISSGNSLYRYDLEGKTCEPVLNWINCDVNSDEVQAFTQLEDGRILAFTFAYGQEGQGLEAVYLTRTPADEVEQKTVLTYATMYLDYDMRAQLIRFNKTNGSCRIEVKEYGNGNYEDGLTQLNNDIVSGNPPDLIDLSNVNVENYIAKGILTDLYPLLEQDETLKKEDFVANALQIYERDGRLYGISPSFGIATIAGKESDVGGREGWTIADVQELLASKPAGTELLEYASKETILEMLVSRGLDSYVDWAAGTCSFNKEDFLSLLEFAGQFPTQESLNYEDSEGTITKLREGKLLLQGLSVHSVTDYLYHDAMFEGQMACIGFPTTDGSMGTYMEASQAIGITEKSAHKDGAWAFIRMLLGEESQDAIHMRGLPLRISSLEKALAKAMEKDENEFSSVIMSDGGFMYEVKEATQEQIDALRRLLEAAKPWKNSDSAILSIVTEEAASYFAGQKTAQEAADIIQSRVQIYISENE